MSLTAQQRALVDEWLPGAEVEKEYSWGLLETTVLALRSASGERFIVKAGGASDRHISREIHAHQKWLKPWTLRHKAPHLVHHDVARKVLVTRFLPGELVMGSIHADDPDVYAQAGDLLAAMHKQTTVRDVHWQTRQIDKAHHWLDQPHSLNPKQVSRFRKLLEASPVGPVETVPTHGDWQPRNWLIDHGVVKVIDFGRTDLRPACMDFHHLEAGAFARDSRLEAAFFEGYGQDSRESVIWLATQIREAIGVVVWACAVGDQGFEALGHRMVADVLERVEV